MSTPTTRDTAAGARDRLVRLLDSPLLAQVVPHLAPETLHQLIAHRGLDACADLVTAATPAQLTALLDLDLWRHAQPGRDARFDVGRFGEWLEVLVDAGDSAAARTVAALDPHVVIAGLSTRVRVFDPGTFEPTESTDDEPIDRHDLMNSETSADVPECEVGGYLVRARSTEAWDAIVLLLVALEHEQHACFHTLMQGCRRLSHSRPEADGLDDLLPAPDQHLHDAAVARERRRLARGYATPAEARAFLQMARQPRTRSASGSPNVLAEAYFRAVDADADATPARLDAWAATHHAAPIGGALASLDGVADLLADAGLLEARPTARLGGLHAAPDAPTLPWLTRLMDHVTQRDHAAALTRARELGFLANTLLEGCAVQDRPFTPGEAAEAAAGVCNLGLERLDAPDAYLADHDLVTAFEAGWSLLHTDVSLFVADRLAAVLEDLRGVDTETRLELLALRRALVRHRDAGTPWLARDAADVLALLDLTAWTSVRGLLAECPILPAALTAILERQATSVSPTAFRFFSTRAQIGDVRLFVRTLPGLVSR